MYIMAPEQLEPHIYHENTEKLPYLTAYKTSPFSVGQMQENKVFSACKYIMFKAS